MKKFIISAFSFALFLTAYTTASAQAVRNTAERASDHRQIQRDKATIQRDQQELAQFIGLRQGLGQAVQNGNVAVAKGYHRKLLIAMEREVQQGGAKIKAARGEVAASNSELASERREVRQDRAQGKPVQAMDDRRDKRDDRRDLQDDRSDLRELKARNARQQEILNVFKAVKVDSKNDAAALWAKKNLLDEFETTMRGDMGENIEELHEDRGELREDRRETREDRRQN